MALDLCVHLIEIIAESRREIVLVLGCESRAEDDGLAHREAELDAMRQQLPDLQQHVIARELVGIAMEMHLGLDGGRPLPCLHRLGDRAVSRGELPLIGLVPVRPKQRINVPIQNLAQREELAQCFLIDVSDERTGIGLVDQQSLLDQLEDRFSDRPGAKLPAKMAFRRISATCALRVLLRISSNSGSFSFMVDQLDPRAVASLHPQGVESVKGSVPPQSI
jgi:hypothetical protein